MCVCYVADYKRGFGGQYGVELERQDQCALGYEHKESLAKHESQKGTETPPEHNTLPHLPFQNPLLILTHPSPEKILVPSLTLHTFLLILSNGCFLLSDGHTFLS